MLDSYRIRMNALGSYSGEAKRNTAQKIMAASWPRDTATKPVYVKWVNQGLPEIDDNDIPVYAKFNVKTYYSIQGDNVESLMQFRIEDMQNNPDIKVGSYVYMANEMGEWEWWMLLNFDDRPQFRQFTILKCLHVYKWVSYKDGYRIMHECLGVPRSQNSYNSGVWLDYRTQTVENQTIMVLPINDDSNTVGYDTKFLISNEGRYPPITWKISKIQPKITGGIVYFTMTQEQFNPSTDNTELMVADYWQSVVEPTIAIPNPESKDLEFVYSGSPAVKAGGSYKKLTIKHIVNNELVDIDTAINWSINSDDIESSDIEYITERNIIKVKCVNNYSLIGKTFDVIADSEYGSKSITIEVISL